MTIEGLLQISSVLANKFLTCSTFEASHWINSQSISLDKSASFSILRAASTTVISSVLKSRANDALNPDPAPTMIHVPFSGSTIYFPIKQILVFSL